MISNHVLVDACVAKSVGNPVHKGSLGAREIVDALRVGAVGLAMTDLLLDEWKKHSSKYMRSWYVNMVSRRRVRHAPDRRVRDYRRAIENLNSSAEIAAVKKDAHLVEAAIRYQLGVISTDDKQRALLAKVAEYYDLVGKVQWVHPNQQHVECLAWLRAGELDRTFSTILARNCS